MNKLICIMALLMFSVSSFSQEGLKISAHVGYPLGDVSDESIVNVQGNVDYLFHITRTIHIGATLGYSHFIAKSDDNIDHEDFIYAPLGGTIQFHLNDYFKIGGDFGYGIVLNPENTEGSFFYSPEVHYIINDYQGLTLAYRSFSIDGGNVNAITIGFEIGLL